MALRVKLWILLVAWSVAFLAIFIPALPAALRNLSGWWTIPDGISWGLERIVGTAGWYTHLNRYWFIAGGWFAYLGLTACCLVTHRKAVFFRVFGLLCLLLVLNIVGCYAASNFNM